MADPATWIQFKSHFTKCFLQYYNKQESLKDAGIANVTLTEDDVSSIITSQLSLQVPDVKLPFQEQTLDHQYFSKGMPGWFLLKKKESMMSMVMQ